MGKGIIRIDKYYQKNWPYSSKNTTFVLPQRYDTSTKTQHTSVYDESVGGHDL